MHLKHRKGAAHFERMSKQLQIKITDYYNYYIINKHLKKKIFLGFM